MGIIGSIRKHSWIAVAIVGIAIIAFIIGDFTKRSNGADMDVAEVNGVALNRIQFENMINQEEARVRLYAQNPTMTFTSEMEKAIRDSLWTNFVDETVIGEQMKKLGLSVSEAEVNDMYTGTFIHPLFAQDPQLRDSTGQYNRTLMASQVKAFNQMKPKNDMEALNKMYWDDTKKAITNDRLRQKYATLVYSGFYMPATIAKQIADYGTKAANISVVSMPYSLVNESEVNVTDADYQKYYNEHKEDFRNLGEEVRVLDYVTFVINPSAKDFTAAQDSAMAAWNKLQVTTDPKELARLVKSESIREYTYDSTYHQASYYPASFRERVESAIVGTEIEPMQIGDKWFMGRVMNIENRPDSIRTSVMFVFSNKFSSQFQRDSAEADRLTDSLLTELNAGRLDFSAAVDNFCDLKLKGETPGDLNWRLEGTLDNVYNGIFEQLFNAQGITFFKGINEQIVAAPAGSHIRFALPEELGYALVKVAEKTTPIKKYRMAVIAQEIRASNETVNEIQNAAYKFLSENHNAKAFAESARKQNMQVMTAYVRLMDDRVNNLDNARDVVKWAFNENTKVGDVNGDVASLDNLFAVMMLKDVYQKGYFTLEQVRSNPGFNIDQAVRTEKRIEIQMAKAEKMAKQCKNIQDVATLLNDSVTVIDSISLFADKFGAFGMEPKVQSTVAVSKANGLMAPIKGARAVYFVQVDSRYEIPSVDAEQLRTSQEYNTRNMLGMTQRGRYLSMDRRLFWWLRTNANVDDHRDMIY